VVSDMLAWRGMVAPNVVEQKDKGWQRSYAARGPDPMGMTPEMLGAQALRANEVLKRFGGQWMFQSEAQRRKVTALPQVAWRYAIAAWIDHCRRQQLFGHPGSYETNYFMTLSHRPTPVAVKHGLRFFMYGPETVRSAQAETTQSVADFVGQADYFMSLLAG